MGICSWENVLISSSGSRNSHQMTKLINPQKINKTVFLSAALLVISSQSVPSTSRTNCFFVAQQRPIFCTQRIAVIDPLQLREIFLFAKMCEMQYSHELVGNFVYDISSDFEKGATIIIVMNSPIFIFVGTTIYK